MKRVLFLCSGDYYRSRFAEIYFNWRANQRRLLWLALVVALTVGWWFDHKHAKEANMNQALQLESDKSQLSEMRKELGIIFHSITRQETPQPPQLEQPIDNMPIMHPPKDYQSMPNAGAGK
jgi:hypothetical protein